MRHRAPGSLRRLFHSLAWRVTRVPVAAALAAVLAVVAGLTVMMSGLGQDANHAADNAGADPLQAHAAEPRVDERSPLSPSREATRPEDPRSAMPSPSATSTRSPTSAPTRALTRALTPTTSPRAEPYPSRTPSLSGDSPAPAASPSTSSTPQSSAPTAAPDETAPRTQIESGPTDESVAPLVFTANEPSTFECSLDGAAFVPCVSPMEVPNLLPGWHTFEVRATDLAGNVGPTAATWRWHTTSADVIGPAE